MWTRTLAYRRRVELPFDASVISPATPVVLDTTVYLDALRAPGLPQPTAAVLARNIILHSAIVCAELALSIGHLDPADPRTPLHKEILEETLLRMPPAQIIAPGVQAWTEAAIIAGILARTQGFAKESRRNLLNDALLVLNAIEAKAALVSRNIRHMDLLLRFRPDAQILLYDRRQQ